MTLDVDVREYDVRGLFIFERVKYPAQFLGLCDRCASTCSNAADVTKCICCRMYGSRKGGGQKIFYPEDGRIHRYVVPFAAFVAKVRSATLARAG